MGDRLVVMLEVVLGPPEVVERLQAGRELGVGEPLELGYGLLAVPARATPTSPAN